ncbi:MAG: sigma-54 dependent transcriptional regulator [Prevotellaceae bacterium]|jgi:DNA-binding NtrC family response regulator|nr:sigma-54 dependent transcriptional regulator [Prevotellaceae bacterium]
MLLRQANILVVDDDKDILTAVRFLLKPEVKRIATDSNPENLRRLLTENDFDILLLDMNFVSSMNTGNEGIYWLRQVKSWNAKVKVIMITAYADIELAIKSLKEGADDFLIKPWHNENLLRTLKETTGKHDTLKEKPAGAKDRQTPGMIGESDIMKDLFRKLEKIAPTDANVLIMGENGTGKDLIAQAIFNASLRKNKPFVKVDAGALTETLFESELFGHKKGAFTDAREDRTGLIESANGGTLFLDEIGNIPLQQQAKLLTVLQNRQIIRLGSNTPIPVDIRLITATNVPFAELANEQRFRKDLIYRINTVEITAPPLRERGNDIILLAGHFLYKYAKKYVRPELSMSEPAKTKLLQYHYPGNVRELQYAMERAVIMASGKVLQPGDIVFSPLEQKPADTQATHNYNLEELERKTIVHAIEKHGGNISKAAKELGLTRAALYRRLEKYGV